MILDFRTLLVENGNANKPAPVKFYNNSTAFFTKWFYVVLRYPWKIASCLERSNQTMHD